MRFSYVGRSSPGLHSAIDDNVDAIALIASSELLAPWPVRTTNAPSRAKASAAAAPMLPAVRSGDDTDLLSEPFQNG